MTTAAISFSVDDWEPLSERARQKRKYVGDRIFRLLQLDVGFQEDEWCFKAHFGYVVAGIFQIQFVDRIEQLQPGDGFAIQGGDAWKHRAVVQDETVTLFLIEPL